MKFQLLLLFSIALCINASTIQRGSFNPRYTLGERIVGAVKMKFQLLLVLSIAFHTYTSSSRLPLENRIVGGSLISSIKEYVLIGKSDHDKLSSRATI
uniref:CSON008530 protein n=1 Tax=Culicoides sonorensis TaxID=179676 RepID=A0A336KEH3_CULSO